MLTCLGGTRHITIPNFFKTGLSAKQRCCNFSIFNFPNGRRIHLLFLKSPNFLANGVQRLKTHEHVKFWQNRSIGYEDIKICSIFQSGGCHHLEFSNLKISLADSVWKAQTHHRAKCRQNRSSSCGEVLMSDDPLDPVSQKIW